MNRRRLATIAIAVSVPMLIVGPDVIDLVRLDQHITESASAAEAEGGHWPRVSDACVACHGVNGGSMNQHYPSLAGQPPQYLVQQLREFSSGSRVHPVMNAMARALNEAEIDAVAQHFARQPARENSSFEPDDRLRKQGEHLVSNGGCAACHGEHLSGRAPFPRLAGQGYDYLLKQLHGYAEGTRKDPGKTMNQLAAALTPGERMAVATFLASHPVP